MLSKGDTFITSDAWLRHKDGWDAEETTRGLRELIAVKIAHSTDHVC